MATYRTVFGNGAEISKHETIESANKEALKFRRKGRWVYVELIDKSEPDLGRMFDMAYEDQCRDACGL